MNSTNKPFLIKNSLVHIGKVYTYKLSDKQKKWIRILQRENQRDRGYFCFSFSLFWDFFSPTCVFMQREHYEQMQNFHTEFVLSIFFSLWKENILCRIIYPIEGITLETCISLFLVPYPFYIHIPFISWW